MEQAVRRFAQRILLVHLGLLAVVLALVFFASRAIRQSAREQALAQARQRQELLANQTARGIEGFYQSILYDLDLLPPAESVADEVGVINSLTGPRGRVNRVQMGQRRNQLGPLLARQLEERVDYLFVYEKARGAAYEVRTDGVPEQASLNSPQRQIVKAFASWLREVDAPSVSPFRMVEGEGGFHLVCQPLPRLRAVVVAAVSVERMNQEFLRPLKSETGTGALVVNHDWIAMAASHEGLGGADLKRDSDPAVKQALEELRGQNYQGTQVLTRPFTLGSQSYEPAVLTAVPIQFSMKVEPPHAEAPKAELSRQWFVLVSSPLADVDSVVGSLFHRIVIWAVFVVVAMTGILVSTAVQMIRGRVKAERIRHEVLTKDLERARQIQQAWLPRTAPACRGVDIAAVNYPAQHISGDFYNWFDLPDGRIAVVIGDVTGHGMSAAFLMATTQLLVRTTMQRINDPGRCLTEVNRQLCTLVFNGQFVTMQALVIDPALRTVDLATAGHPAPLVAAAAPSQEANHAGNGSHAPGFGPAAGESAPPAFQSLPLEPQLVLGVDAEATYDTEHFTLPPGGVLLLYTDGAADVQAPDGRRLGNDGLRRCLSPALLGSPGASDRAERQPERASSGFPALSNPAACGDAKALIDRVVDAVNLFRGSQALADDLTLVALRLQGNAKVAPKRPVAAAAVP